MSFNWTCPHCNRPQTVTGYSYDQKQVAFETSPTDMGHLGFACDLIVCSNPDCNKPTVAAQIIKAGCSNSGRYYVENPRTVHLDRRLIPDCAAKPQPDFIPAVLREDYLEACKIRDLSPKASATLARRCLQGMIRDFACVKERTLYREIEKLRELAKSGNAPTGVSEDSIDSLHHVRSLGNIGAHMERDIDILISVEPTEAQILIELIETLFDEWYVARNRRRARFVALKATAEEKQTLKEMPKPANPE